MAIAPWGGSAPGATAVFVGRWRRDDGHASGVNLKEVGGCVLEKSLATMYPEHVHVAG